MALKGKGFMIWKVRDCEGGNAEAIASVAQAAGFTHVDIKVAEEDKFYNVDKNTGADYVPAVVKALHARGIQVWGWHYVYGYKPQGEAQIAVKRVNELGLDGYIIDAEVEYKLPGREDNAKIYMKTLRDGLPHTPIALCAFRFPSYHRQFPWKEFLDKCDYNMPQVYWEQAHNPDAQLRQCVREFQAMSPFRPILPVGPIYKNGGWTASAEEITQFLKTSQELSLSSVSFFSWEYGRSILKPLWNAVSSYSWGGQPPVSGIPGQYFAAMNSHKPAEVVKLFKQDAVHITSAQTIQGENALRSWYKNFLTSVFPDATFKLTGTSGTPTAVHATWTATSSNGKIKNGKDTFGILDGKISYHYSNFSILKPKEVET